MESFLDPFADTDSLGMDGFTDREHPFSPHQSLEPRVIASPSTLGVTPRLPGDIYSSAAGWPLRSSSPGLSTRKPSVGSFLDIPEHSTSISQSPMLQGVASVSMGLADASFDPLRQSSPGDNWLRKSSPGGDIWPQQQQQRLQQPAAEVIRNQYREPHASQGSDIQQLVPSSQGLAPQQWMQQGLQQQQQQQQQQPQPQGQFMQRGMMPLGAGVTSMVPIPSVSRPIVASTAAVPAGGVQLSQQGSAATAAKGQQLQHQTAEEMETDDEYNILAQQRQRQQLQQQSQPGWQQQQQPTGKHNMVQGFGQQQPGSLPGSGTDLSQLEQLSSWQGFQEQQQQQQLDAAAGPPPPAAAAAGTTSKKKSKGSGSSKKPAVSAAAASTTAADGDFSGLWKPPPQPKEAKIPKEPGVDYEDMIPQGLDANNTRPLPIPTDILQLQDLREVLNLDTWNNVLDESDRAQLRGLLPTSGSGFNESSGFEGLGLEALLSGHANFHFGNPTAKMWGDISTGTANPRLRRQQETVIQLRQQLAAAQLRNYHNTQVSTLLQMQRLWATQLPADAGTAERLALWKAAQKGDVGMPVAAAAAADGDDMDEAEDATEDAHGDEAAAAAVVRPTGAAAAGVADSSAPVAVGSAAAITASPAVPGSVPGPSSSNPAHPAAATAAAAVGGEPSWSAQEPAQLGKRSASTGVAVAIAAAAAAAGIRPASSAAAGEGRGGGLGGDSGAHQPSATAGMLSAVQVPIAAAFPAGLAPKHPALKSSTAPPKPQANQVAQKAAAAGKVYPSIGASRHNVYVYEGPVDFSKNLTKRQAAAAAAAVAAAAAKQQGVDEQSGGDPGVGQEAMNID